MKPVKTQDEWAAKASAFLKRKLRECDVTYVQLAERLKKHGFKETGSLDHEQAQKGNVFGNILVGMPCGDGIGRDNLG
jgi:hypothetical protein